MTDPKPLIENEDLLALLETEGELQPIEDTRPLCNRCVINPRRLKAPGARKSPILCESCHAAGQVRKKPGDGQVNVNLGLGAPPRLGKVDKDRAAVEAKAKQAAQFIAIALAMVGQTDDAGTLTDGAGAWAGAVGGLAPYEPWLVKLCAGGEVSGRAIAWLGVVMATLGLAAPVLMRHGMIPEGPLRAAIGSIVDMANASV